MKKGLLLAALCLALAGTAQANLVTNGSFDDGNAGWSYGGNTYFYEANGDTICSMGWWDGVAIWQNTGHEIMADTEYTLTVRAASGDGQLEGVRLALEDVTAGWADIVPEQDFWFPAEDQGQNPGAWREYSLSFNSADYPEIVGHQIAVGVKLADTAEWNNYGWLWVDQVTLVPEPATMLLVGLGGLVLRRRRQ